MTEQVVLTSTTAPAAVDDVPPSAKLVLTVLAHEGSLTQSQLAEETLLPTRTVRYAMNKLEDHDLVDSQISFSDARQHVYSLNTDRFADARQELQS
ncbi:MarR family transcriptional regulator [Natrinema longum]|uniref:Winged helix-turn-helix transcriptional regulator n=1 Tax=Natrinema longum TaxID=370324 RepID=A0A8A2UBS7_9EURY|nr:helix-turn-helix domain-containing protein [Natrinema longum]MBZ6495913.1 MarR family winged helix-turn-helix transcriptional regulator [Natrinema longum]QSW86146.1 winged helix-turn-helix transcriptional regulator [Natrinema longum]